MIKLQEIINNKEKWSFEARDGKVYEFDFFVPISIVKLKEELADEKSDFVNMVKVVECLLLPQFDFMDSGWITDNMSYANAKIIYVAIIQKMSDSIEAMNAIKGSDKKKGVWPFKK